MVGAGERKGITAWRIFTELWWQRGKSGVRLLFQRHGFGSISQMMASTAPNSVSNCVCVWWALWFLASQATRSGEHSCSVHCFSRNSLINNVKSTQWKTQKTPCQATVCEILFMSSHALMEKARSLCPMHGCLTPMSPAPKVVHFYLSLILFSSKIGQLIPPKKPVLLMLFLFLGDSLYFCLLIQALPIL